MLNERKVNLSIAIPTYNRPKQLENCLRSILSQVFDGVEIVVSDNSSSLDSCFVVQRLEKEYKYPIKYSRNLENIGLDRNFHRVVALSSGEYVQWLSDDDELLPGSIDYVYELVLIKLKQPTFIFLNSIGYREVAGSRVWSQPIVNANEHIDSSTPEKAINLMGGYVTFISAFCFPRREWLDLVDSKNYFGTNLYLTYALLGFLSRYRQVVIIQKPLVAHREVYEGNFPLLSTYTIGLKKIFTEYSLICNFNKKSMNNTYDKILSKDIFQLMYCYKMGVFEANCRVNVFNDIIRPLWGRKIFWLKFFPILILPRYVIKIIKNIYDKI